jgi:hypothetical protein
MKRYHVHACLNGITVFREGRETTEDDETSGRMCTTHNPRTFRGCEIFCNNIVKLPAECCHLNIGKTACQDILPGFTYRKKNECQTHTALTPEQKEDRSASFAKLLETA